MNATALESGSKEGGYAVDIFDNLVYRYEEPNGMTRWDSPLFTVPYDDETPPCQDIWDAMVGTEGKVKTVKPNLATVTVKFQYLRCCSGKELTYPETRRRVRLPLRTRQGLTGITQCNHGMAEGSSGRGRRRACSSGRYHRTTCNSSLIATTAESQTPVHITEPITQSSEGQDPKFLH